MASNTKEVSGWVGWVGFAGVMLYLAGFFHIVAGVLALFKSTVYVMSESSLWMLDYTQWGWIHIIGGIVLVAAASSLVTGNTFGRVIAVLAALISAVVNMLFIPIYPIWSILIMVMSILVVYAVIVHGGDLKSKQ